MLILWKLTYFLCLIILNSKHFKVLGGLVFCMFIIYSDFMVCFIFLCPYFTDPFKIASMNVVWEILPKFQAIKQFKKKMKSLNYFGKQSMFTTLFLLSLNSRNLLEGRDTFQLIQKKHATQCRNFLEHKETFRTL